MRSVNLAILYVLFNHLFLFTIQIKIETIQTAYIFICKQL